MRLIGTYSNAGLQATADAALAFYERRPDLHTSGLSFGDDPNNPRKVSTDISWCGSTAVIQRPLGLAIC